MRVDRDLKNKLDEDTILVEQIIKVHRLCSQLKHQRASSEDRSFFHGSFSHTPPTAHPTTHFPFQEAPEFEITENTEYVVLQGLVEKDERAAKINPRNIK